MVNQEKNERKKSHVLLPVLLSAFAIPISMLFWIFNVVYSTLTPEADSHTESKCQQLSFFR